MAVVAVTTLLAGAPGYVNLLFGSPTKAEVELIRERQNSVLQRLGIIEERLNSGQSLYADLREEIRALRELIDEHVQTDRR